MIGASIPAGFSRSLDPTSLDRSGRRLFVALLVAVLFHAGLAVIVPYRTPGSVHSRRESYRIIRTDIIEIPASPPEIPFLMERPRFIPRSIRPYSPRSGFTAESRGEPDAPLPYGPVIPGERPDTYGPDLPIPGMPGPDTDSQFKVPGRFETGEPPGRTGARDMPLRGEALRSEDFEWSREGVKTGMIEYNPDDRLAIRGIVPLPQVYSSTVLHSVGMQGLSDGIRKYTDLTVGARKQVFFSERDMALYPFIYLACSGPWEYHSWEVKALSEYVRRGGFIFLEAILQDELDPAEKVLRQFIREALGPRNRLQPIPNDHPIYSCYFDFPDGPPVMPANTAYSGTGRGMGLPWLEGVWIDGRLVLVMSGKGYGGRWDSESGGGDALRLGINLLIYALRQEGGNTPKRHDASLRPGIHAQRNLAGKALVPSSEKAGD